MSDDAADGGEGDFVFDGVDEAEAVDGEAKVGDEATDGDDGRRRTGPAPGVAPEAVVRAQLDAIEAGSANASADGAASANDGEIPESVLVLFEHAAPSFRTAHGSLEGFATTLRGPMFDRLVEASTVERGPGERDGATYEQAVLARHPDGDRTYEFVLECVESGKYADCWMTTRIDLVYDGESPSFRRTPTVRFGDREVTCEVGDRLRDVLLAAEGYSPHNDVTQVANCGGNGLCGTCAVDVDGDVSEMASREERRLNLPPHEAASGLRLSCQTCVQGDVTVRKHDGYWGQHVEDASTDDETVAAAGDATESTRADVIEVTAAEYAGEFDYAVDATGGGRR